MADLADESVGYMKFSGEAVPGGVIGAGAAGTTLLGLDECLRYFGKKQSSSLTRVEYEIPVKITEGSWIVWVLGVVGTGTAIFAGSYLKKAAERMAENDVGTGGLKDILRKSFEAMRYFLALMKHTEGVKEWENLELSWRVSDGLVGITNKIGNIIYLPIEYFRWYLDAPPNILRQVTEAVDVQRTLTIGVNKGDHYETTTITAADKLFFGHELAASEEEILFPEMEHGSVVRLEGHLTRGNENSNSVGLEYNGHVINCVPETGNIKRYKSALFLRCIVEGTVSRLFKQSVFAEKRPTIIFSSITPLEADDQIKLFGH